MHQNLKVRNFDSELRQTIKVTVPLSLAVDLSTDHICLANNKWTL